MLTILISFILFVSAARAAAPYTQDSDIKANAAIAYSKLATLPSANLLVGSAGGVATVRSITGDVTISNSGVTTLRALVAADIPTSPNISQSITQTAHGFTVGQWLYYTGTVYALAKADADSTSEVLGVVSSVAGVNSFTLLNAGLVPSGLSGLTAGTTYFLSAATAGALTATAPSTTGQISKPLLVALSATAGIAIESRGIVVNGGGGGTTLSISTKTASYTVTNADDVIITNCSAACTMTMQAVSTATAKAFRFINKGSISPSFVPNGADKFNNDSSLTVRVDTTNWPSFTAIPDGSTTWLISN